jgi:hypothetical protein
MLRSHLMVSPLLLALVLGACGPKSGKSPEVAAAEAARPYVERPSEEGLVLVEIDLNSDGRPDVFNHYRERSQATRLLVRKDVDLNWDGKVDITSFYDDTARLVREEMDNDFDGKVDIVDHYQGGVRVMSEVDTEYDGRFDLWKYYEQPPGGKPMLRRKERDTNADGKVDYWEYFNDQGQVVKTGRDVDGDGVMDERQEVGGPGSPAGATAQGD